MRKVGRRRNPLWNANAAPAYGLERSSHLTGATVDITKIGMAAKQVSWMRRRLNELEKNELIEYVEEVNQQSTFHIMVFAKYCKKNGEINTPLE